LLVARRDARVHRDGIHFRRLRFTAAGLAELVGETVQIAFAPHDDRSIEVFHRGQWRCTAAPQETLSPDQRAAVLAARRAHAQDLRRRQRAAARRARTRIAPITATSRAITEVTELPAEERSSLGRLRLLAGEARADLLLSHERARER
jgi:putative transposase